MLWSPIKSFLFIFSKKSLIDSPIVPLELIDIEIKIWFDVSKIITVFGILFCPSFLLSLITEEFGLFSNKSSTFEWSFWEGRIVLSAVLISELEFFFSATTKKNGNRRDD